MLVVGIDGQSWRNGYGWLAESPRWRSTSYNAMLHADGVDHERSRPVAGVVVATRWRDANILETVARQNVQVVGDGRYEVSADGRVLTATVAGIDAAGARFEQVIVFDRG